MKGQKSGVFLNDQVFTFLAIILGSPDVTESGNEEFEFKWNLRRVEGVCSRAIHGGVEHEG